MILRKLNIQGRKKRLLGQEIQQLRKMGYNVGDLPENFMQIKRPISSTEIKSLMSLSQKYENGTSINYLHNIIANNIQEVQQRSGQQPIIGHIVPIYNKYLQYQPNQIYVDGAIKYYILGKKTTLSGVDYKILSTLFACQFGVPEGSMSMPDVVNLGIVGGKHIFKKGTSGYIGQDTFDSIYRGVIGVTTDLNGDAAPIAPEDTNAAFDENGDKKIQQMPAHVHTIYQQRPQQAYLSPEMQPQNWVKYPLGGRAADGIPPVLSGEYPTTNKNYEGKGLPISIKDPGTYDIVLALIIDIVK